MSHIILIKTIADLEKNRQRLDKLYSDYGRIYFHHPDSMKATFRQRLGSDCVLALNEDFGIASMFLNKSGGLWQCEFQGFPLLVTNDKVDLINQYLINVKKALSASTIYFPLVYKGSDLNSSLLTIKGGLAFPRLASPIVEGNLSEEEIWNRVLTRYGSRANRQKKLFESSLHIDSNTGTDARRMLEIVENNSWKKSFNQDMLSRDNQFEYYSSLITEGVANITFAMTSDGYPVAYRIDSLTNNVLHVLKWSYDEEYKKYSPGFYLIVVDLFKRLKSKSIKYVDLYGSPDLLKAILETNRLDRVDLYFSDNKDVIVRISDERKNYDKRVSENFMSNKSVKKLFSKRIVVT